jgi:hypothetical protein
LVSSADIFVGAADLVAPEPDTAAADRFDPLEHRIAFLGADRFAKQAAELTDIPSQ